MGAIAKLKKGALLKEIAPTVDQLVDAINAILAGEVKITETKGDKSSGKFIISDSNSVLQLILKPSGGKIDVSDDDGHEVTDIETLEFVGYNATVVSDGGLDDAGKKVALIKVFPDPPGSGTFALTSTSGDVDWSEVCDTDTDSLSLD